MKPHYSFEKIKFSTDQGIFERAIELVQKGKVTKFKTGPGEFSATVIGSQPYKVWVSAMHHDQGDCNCYLGQNDTLCKHMVAVAIRAVMGNRKLTEDQKQYVSEPSSSGKRGKLSKSRLAEIKKSIFYFV